MSEYMEHLNRLNQWIETIRNELNINRGIYHNINAIEVKNIKQSINVISSNITEKIMPVEIN